MKKIISLILAVIAVVGLTIPAFASYYPPAEKCKEDEGCYVIYNIHGNYGPYFYFSKEYWDKMPETEQKEFCLNEEIFSLNSIYNTVTTSYISKKNYDPSYNWPGQTTIINVKNEDELLDYNYLRDIVIKETEKYTPDKYSPVEFNNKQYYGQIVFIYENEFSGNSQQESSQPDKDNNDVNNNLTSIFIAIINALKDFFNSIFGIFKK